MLRFLKHLFKLQFLLIVIALLVGVYLPQIKDAVLEYTLGWVTSTQQPVPLHFKADQTTGERKPVVFSKEQLATYNGENGAPIYLALLGNVYDVSKGVKHYGTGCAYNFFVGRDASVSFVTGEFEHFEENVADDVVKLKPGDLLSLENWKKFYDKDYTYKGKLIGRFYDATGAPTAYFFKYQALLDQAKDTKAAEDQLRVQYPDCNIEWSADTGTRVWCTPDSGGKHREWAGYPRKMFEVGTDTFRCACIREEDLDTTMVMIKPYADCERLSLECFYWVH